MFSLAYVSEAAVPFDNAALADLAAKASTKNARIKVTGYLNYHPRRRTFFQFLEGPRSTVLDLMDQIASDDRHQVRNLIHLRELDTRLFPQWNMRYVDSTYLRAVELEDVLENVLMTMSEKVFDRDTVVGTVLRIAERIAARESP